MAGWGGDAVLEGRAVVQSGRASISKSVLVVQVLSHMMGSDFLSGDVQLKASAAEITKVSRWNSEPSRF